MWVVTGHYNAAATLQPSLIPGVPTKGPEMGIFLYFIQRWYTAVVTLPKCLIHVNSCNLPNSKYIEHNTVNICIALTILSQYNLTIMKYQLIINIPILQMRCMVYEVGNPKPKSLLLAGTFLSPLTCFFYPHSPSYPSTLAPFLSLLYFFLLSYPLSSLFPDQPEVG